MNLHTLKNTPGARKTKKRLGRGMASGLGKTAGRGHKGQYARSGHKHKPGFEGGQMRLIRRLPKRGFKNISRMEYLPVNVGDLEGFRAGAEVTPETLKAKGFANGPGDGIKILGAGALTKKLTVKAHAFSAGAKTKIEAAGGSCEVVK
jgi:large subunit ribosomal protein L15